MSVMHLKPAHIAAMVGTYLGTGPNYLDIPPQRIAMALARENALSYRDRYDEPCEPVRVPQSMIDYYTANPLSPGAMLKAIQCWEYHASEARGYADSDGCSIAERMRGATCKRVAGYEEAPWSIDELPAGAGKVTRII